MFKRILARRGGELRGEQRDVHMGEPGFLRKLLRRKQLEGLFLFVTSDCNSRCRTCFYSRELNKGEDMTLAQIRRMAETSPKFDKLWLSGGEPTMRDDLVEIVTHFARHCGIKAVNFPTNGLRPEPLERMLETLLERCEDLAIHLNFSVDGLGPTHDAVRGVPGGFERVTSTIERVERRFGGHPRLHCNAATVVTPDAVDELFDLAVYLFKRFELATHFFEVVRGDPRDPATRRLGRARLEELHRQVLPIYEAMAARLFDQLPRGGRELAKLYFIGVIRLLYKNQEENLEGPRPWGMSCTAGQTTLVVDHDGRFRSCELRPPIGRMQDHDFDVGAVLRSSAMRSEIAAIGGGRAANCWCTHGCWVLSSMKFSPRTLLYEVPRLWLRYKLSGAPPFDPGRFDLQQLERAYLEDAA